MNPQPPPEEERFAKNAQVMGAAVHEAVVKLFRAGYKTVDPNLIGMANMIMGGFDKHYLIQGFIDNSHQECWDFIKHRDEEFFVANAGKIFQYLPTDKVDLFKDLFTTRDEQGRSVVSLELKNEIWKLFDAMIKISIKYIHKRRDPYAQHTSEGIIHTYGAQFYEHVELGRHAQTWGVQLEFPLRAI
jgi:hypothetical protein